MDHHLVWGFNLAPTAQVQILLETHTLRNWELQCSHVQIIAPQTPSEVIRRNHILSESPECVSIRDCEISCLIDVCSFLLDIERREVENAQCNLFGGINPRDVQGLREANLSREDTCM